MLQESYPKIRSVYMIMLIPQVSAYETTASIFYVGYSMYIYYFAVQVYVSC